MTEWIRRYEKNGAGLYAYIGVSAFAVVCMIIQMSSERPCSAEEIRTLM